MAEATDTNRSTWNKHKWKRDAGWWDDLEVPADRCLDDPFGWLEENAPDPAEHDYILSTDGSGCAKGWGGYAAVIQKVDLDPETGYREIVKARSLVAGTYGSTVQRCEFSALLDGVWAILTDRCLELEDEAAVDEQQRYHLASQGTINTLRGPDRVSVLWYTDRKNLAQSMLFSEDGDPLYARTTERDLWMRWSFLAKYVCLTPQYVSRNVLPAQAACDAMAGSARRSMMDIEESLANTTQLFHPPDQWQKKVSQKAPF